jgi:hypothetical protein
MSLYSILITDPNGVLLADLSNLCAKRHFLLVRNGEGSIDLSLNLTAAEQLADDLGYRGQFYGLFASGLNEIRVMRGARPFVGGQILEALPSLDATGGTLDLKAEGYLGLFKDRQLWPDDTLNYTSIDIGQLAWSRINQTQSKPNGDWGFTMGEIQPSRSIVEIQNAFGQSIRDLLVSYTELSDSGDFEFTADKQFNWHYPGLGQDQFDLPFQWGGNIAKLSAARNGAQLANIVISRGSGNGGAQLAQSATDSSSLAIFKRRERVFDYASVPNTAYLDSQGDERLRTNAYPLVLPAITLDGNKRPFLGAYWLGDRVPLQIPGRSSFAHLDGQMARINEIDITVSDLDHEDIAVQASLA